MRFGADYYPEHWPEQRWQKDAELMQAAGINVVRIGEFAWCKMEPEEGKHDFSWLDRVISILSEKGIDVVLCTPTAAPPNWLIQKHRDILPKNAMRIVKEIGSRRHYCLNNKIYQKYTEKIVTALAEYFKTNKSVIAWHIDNEFGCHDTTRCYCDNCSDSFRKWLKKKYETLDELNKRWGTIFWSQWYNEWEQIPLPWYNVAGHNPALVLDFYRFSSDSNVKYQQLQIDILKRITPNIAITHNLMGRFREIDYYNLAENLDFVSWDNYPNLGAPYRPAVGHDIMRGVGRGKNFWVMEHQCGQTNWDRINSCLRPKMARLWTYQSIGHGADAIVYFRWRWCRFGAEKFHSGILAHNGTGDNRVYKEISEIGKEIARIGNEIEGSKVISEVAMLYNYEDGWALDYKPFPTERIEYLDHFEYYYKALHKLNVSVDIVHPEMDLSKYRMVVAPMLHIVSKKIRDNLYNYVKNGGVLISTLFSGIVDEYDTVTDKSYPGELGELFGIRVVECDPIPASIGNSVRVADESLSRKEYAVDIWCDVIQSNSAEVIAVFTSDFYADMPAITLNRYGNGKAIYVGTIGKGSFFVDLMKWGLKQAGIEAPFHTEEGVEVLRREDDATIFTFLLNHNNHEVSIKLPEPAIDLISNKNMEGNISLGPREVGVLKGAKR